MEQMPGEKAYEQLAKNIRNRTFRLPMKGESKVVGGMLLPTLAPKFLLQQGEGIFTIGSCFAREIEYRLQEKGFNVPVSYFQIENLATEYPVYLRAPSLLNEYNPGTILQRIQSVFGQFDYQESMGLEETEQGFVDLFLHFRNKPVPLSRLLERRQEIAELYKKILSCETVVITLGLVECWFDTLHHCYLNKSPSKKMVLHHPGRFQLHRMGVEEAAERLTRVVELLNQHSGQKPGKKILLTVSPIPMEASFMPVDAIMANAYAKSVLRVVAEQISQRFDHVDYFPSFEMALSGGIGFFEEDNIHLSAGAVDQIISHMLDAYDASKAEAIHDAAAAVGVGAKPHYMDEAFKDV